MNRYTLTWALVILLSLNSLAPGNAEAQAVRDAGYEQRMAWFHDARFGMFIHFGLYSEAAGLWDGKPVGFVEYFGFRNPNQWQKLLDDFNPTDFDAEKIVQSAKAAGMKYLVITSKHHDGFCLFDSQYTDFDVMSTPFKRDIVGELAEACRKHGLRFGFYYSIIDLNHPDYLPRSGFDPRPADGADFDRYLQFMKDQLKELLTNYGSIDVVWFDGEWVDIWTSEHAQEMWDFIREIDPDVLINNRIDKGRAGMQGMNKAEHYLGDFGTPEQELLERNPGEAWETCQTMNRHGNWGWRKDEGNYYTKTELIHQLITCASMGGNLLLNVGPKDDGSIPHAQQERLDTIGQWMQAHGQTIYGSQASPYTRSPDWGRVTVKDDAMYCHIFSWPDDAKLVLPPLDHAPSKAWSLADDQETSLKFEPLEDGTIVVDLAEVKRDQHVTVIALSFEQTPTAPPFSIRADSKGRHILSAKDAAIHGSAKYAADKESIGHWVDANTTISWPITIKPGKYRVEVTYGCDQGEGGTYAVALGDNQVTAKSQSTGGWFDRETHTIGEFSVEHEEATELTVSIIEKPGVAVFDFQSVVLIPLEK